MPASDLEAGVPRSPTATTGLPELDAALGGLFWGDNVVWEAEDADSLEPFFGALVQSRPRYDFAAWVTLTRSPEELQERYPGFEVIDARPESDLAQPGALIQAVRQACSSRLHDLVLFDGLEADERALGSEDGAAVLHAQLPPPAGARRDRVLVARADGAPAGDAS